MFGVLRPASVGAKVPKEFGALGSAAEATAPEGVEQQRMAEAKIKPSTSLAFADFATQATREDLYHWRLAPATLIKVTNKTQVDRQPTSDVVEY